ncbi:hypothetical protein C731_2138 [Mycolicibacterium hassiacum DSM 44199]|uniref:Uncharacterized protein n=1 Tax=Mycolicibacterium hassiacum (strain DSM 44199 / CIP 105218 / JCM 12690 / 3849) TaxID=1122247 RepID=K5BBC9_MYCHD|nr:hypothetical protein C731_2138 [Mycolicibacterium hassiacum DSM 44199]
MPAGNRRAERTEAACHLSSVTAAHPGPRLLRVPLLYAAPGITSQCCCEIQLGRFRPPHPWGDRPSVAGVRIHHRR